jgi:SAM-dependent methyltransferase
MGVKMDAKAMEPFGKALLAYQNGDLGAEILLRRDDGHEATIPIWLFFRDESKFTELEKMAMQLCKGRVLDVGSGAGLHSLVLQNRGYKVTALDISPEAAAVARQRGVSDVHCGDILTFAGGSFDTLLLMGHGIGMVETIDGLKSFLSFAHRLLNVDGQIILDSVDVRVTDNVEHLAYHERNRKAGRYIGEIRTLFEFRDSKGPFCGWLQVDAETLTEQAKQAGWQCQVVLQSENGNYLARLTR